MTQATIRANLKTILAGVTNAGVVHDYERWAKDYSDYLDKFKTTIGGSEVIRGWTIQAESFTAEKLTYQGIIRTWSFKLRGYFGLNDELATEKTIAALVETVCDTLDANTTIHPTSGNSFGAPAQLEIFEARQFGGVLCHYAEITQVLAEST